MTDILLIDNHDSFTHLLADLIHRASGIAPRIVPNDAPESELDLHHADLIVVSPGPGAPTRELLGASAAAIEQSTIPVFGVCLGHQAIAHLAGAEFRRSPFPMHGRESLVRHCGTGIFADLPSPLPVIRYHSLDITEHPTVNVLARADDGTIMAIAHRHKPQWGVQFHPESIGTAHGIQLIQNLLVEAGITQRWHRRETALIPPEQVAASWSHYPYLCWLDTATEDGPHLLAAGSKLVSLPDIPRVVLTADSAVAPTFVPGAIGVLSYEASALVDGGVVVDKLLAPEIVYQIVQGRAYLLTPDAQRGHTLTPAPVTPATVHAEPTMRHSREQYRELISRCQEEIAAGNSYELCLTTAAAAEVGSDIDPLGWYVALRQLAPSPMAGFYRCPEQAVLSASPERFLEVKNGVARACPIKGTRSRAADPIRDAALVAELASAEKDRAENLMIVDLLRNDLARTCTDISVPELCAVHTFSHAHQLISTISGRVRPGVRTYEVIQSAFPGGSMTGAPKQSSMEILSGLEQAPRGNYSGIMGYISADGAADFSILIRTITLAGAWAHYGAGGAITALSDPDEEYDEVLVKMRPFFELLQS
ncbi:chorismate-binding protein [Staphylococcus chromogenes]|nr:chorismate-binding protein [Staphylococcus chromogenes]